MRKWSISVVVSCLGFFLVYTSQFMITWDQYKKTHDNGRRILNLF